MALSTDPEKRARQLAGLQKGRESLARRILGIDDDAAAPPAKAPVKPAAKAPAKASPGTRAKATKAPAKAKPRRAQAPAQDTISYPDEREDHPDGPTDDQPRRPGPRRRAPERRPGFLDGLLGRL